jgi:hypothetical protein
MEIVEAMSRYLRAIRILAPLLLTVWSATVEAHDFRACQVNSKGIREVRLGMSLEELIQKSDVIVRDQFLAGESQVSAYRVEVPRCNLSLEVWDINQDGRAGLLIFDSPGVRTIDGISTGQRVKEINALTRDFRLSAGHDEGSFVSIISRVGIVYSIDPSSFSKDWLTKPDWSDERFLNARVSSVMLAELE